MYKRSSQFLRNLRIISAITPIWVATSTSAVPAPVARCSGGDGCWVLKTTALPHPACVPGVASALPGTWG